MTKVLVALDGSQQAARAARAARRLFSDRPVELTVIGVTAARPKKVPLGAFGERPVVIGDWDELMSEPDQAAVRNMAEASGVPDARVVAAIGDPAERICRAAEERDVDVIVVGSCSRGVISRLIAPSVSAGVIRGTHRPVLVVDGEAA